MAQAPIPLERLLLSLPIAAAALPATPAIKPPEMSTTEATPLTDAAEPVLGGIRRRPLALLG